MKIRRSEERGSLDLDWLRSRHTFSFGHYYDPLHMGFGHLRVINEDRVQPGQGFGSHSHQNMEILSYVIKGAMQHKDTVGSTTILRPGDLQRMSAGTGVRHSEINCSSVDPLHFLQIWVQPEKNGLLPGYEQKRFDKAEKLGQLRLIASRDARDDSVTIQQDVNLYATLLTAGETVVFDLSTHRSCWIQVISGTAQVSQKQTYEATLSAGDGAAIEQPGRISLNGSPDAEVLLFDMG